jgi:hypothetical protein
MNHSDSISKTYKVELKTELLYWLILLPCIFIFGIFTKKGIFEAWPFMLILIVAGVLFSVLLYRLTQIDINTSEGSVSLTKTNLLRNKRTKTYSLHELQFTYKREKPGLRHRIVNICRLYINGKEIAELIPDHDGWTDDSVDDLAKGLHQMGVDKKLVGYGTKDAEINGL